MPKRPTELRVGPRVYTVHWSQEAWDSVRLNDDLPEGQMGRTKHFPLEVWVRPDLHPAQQRETLLHEILHCVFSTYLPEMSNVKDLSNLEEFLVDGLDVPLLQVLRDNPKVLAWLVADWTNGGGQ